MLAALALSSCAKKEPSFDALLARIDAAKGQNDEAAFVSAAALADTTEDRLRLLKRARGRSPYLYADIASAILKTGSVSEAVTLAACDAFIEAGRYGEALALFEGTLPTEGHEALLAEAVTGAAREGEPGVISAANLVACAEATGDGRYLVYAAVNALAAGDASLAATLLSDRLVLPAMVPVSVLWDSGCHQKLLDSPVAVDDPLGLSVLADASRELGQVAMATELYATVVERFPYWSWKPYAALARLEREATLANESALASERGGFDESAILATRLAFREREPTNDGRSWYELMMDRFPDSEEAALEYAAWLRTQDRDAEALAVSAKLTEYNAALARLAYGSFDLLEKEALDLLAAYGDDPQAVDAALCSLARARAWPSFVDALDKAEVKGLHPERLWFWNTLGQALAGDSEAAAEELRRHGAGRGGYAAAMDLGMLEMAGSRPAAAAEAFEIAVSTAATPEAKAEALVLAGDAYARGGDTLKARKAYTAAINACESNRDARSRLERLGS